MDEIPDKECYTENIYYKVNNTDKEVSIYKEIKNIAENIAENILSYICSQINIIENLNCNNIDFENNFIMKIFILIMEEVDIVNNKEIIKEIIDDIIEGGNDDDIIEGGNDNIIDNTNIDNISINSNNKELEIYGGNMFSEYINKFQNNIKDQQEIILKIKKINGNIILELLSIVLALMYSLKTVSFSIRLK